MISLEHRQHLVELINEAVDSGARVAQACSTVNIHDTTYRRWHDTGTVKADARPLAVRSEPRNKRKRQRIRVSCVLTFPYFIFHGMSASKASSVSASAMCSRTYCR